MDRTRSALLWGDLGLGLTTQGGLGFRVEGLGFLRVWVQGLGFRIWSLGFWSWSLGCWCLCFGVLGFRPRALGYFEN